jgi:hypothetical protein
MHHGGATARSSSGRLLATMPLSLKKGHASGRMLALGREFTGVSRGSDDLRHRADGAEERDACLHEEGKMKCDLKVNGGARGRGEKLGATVAVAFSAGGDGQAE